jgi:hypothetical protein
LYVFNDHFIFILLLFTPRAIGTSSTHALRLRPAAKKYAQATAVQGFTQDLCALATQASLLFSLLYMSVFPVLSILFSILSVLATL